MLALSLIAGLALLLVGGDLLVRGAVGVASRLGLSPMVIGLTLVGFGTSTPELLTSLQGALAGAPGIAVGNVVGSNIANILLILGVAALIRPVAVERAGFLRDAAVLALATAAAIALCLAGGVGRVAGAVLLAGLVAYLVAALRFSGPAPAAVDAGEADLAPAPPQRLALSLGLFAGGLLLVLGGARLLVDGAVALAAAAGLSETVIGLTIVAIGTSLPELVTSASAALRGESGVAFGNVVGSNIFNLLGILGATALAVPLTVPPEVASRDVWALAAATALFVAVAVTGWRVTRIEGGGLVALFAAYMALLVLGAP
jgi:cation:H+ antiporter